MGVKVPVGAPCIDCREAGQTNPGRVCSNGNWRCRYHHRVWTRRATLLTRTINAPHGLTAYEFTRGFDKLDALQFWVDAQSIGLVEVGTSKRGAKMYALPSVEVAL